MLKHFFSNKFLVLFTSVILVIVGCQSQPQTNTNPATTPELAESVSLNGAGATFPEFLYQKWFQEYNQQHPNVQLNYQAIGSAAGIKQVISNTIDFGASDIAMSDEEIKQVSKGVVLLPMTAGSVVIAYNLPNIKSGLKLSRQVYADMFLGKITRWNDSQIKTLNPDINLPDLPILLVHRSDGSGTTAVFTKHLSAISPEWQKKVGSGLNVQWLTGVAIKSSSGVTAQIQQQPGTIGYVESTYAAESNLSTAALQNKAGNYIEPNTQSVTEALRSKPLSDDLRVFITDPEGDNSYPIVTYTWLLAYKNYAEPNKAKVFKDVVKWCLTDGEKFATELGYIPLPKDAIDKVENALKEIK
ncbi:phosphate ABC transporter substrate-binding protein PstS [Rivularia sp. UHCC 0363]|uniref:phosphate ABC transporter substrate-binding protein PstS n=1 Tax=Rivularia sp. UHCC 0363 TaxID=3110244 RepID=UPI002B21F1CA|nr:phosphate ABC transporter substrate-binding protein PstS [Rivularia sp. UHCC 0363]MEA5593146.1 phosphate ABC transporter substrate-binding protein PstS [Rivularia sp. UHCC 0363]